jgi:serine protease Do
MNDFYKLSQRARRVVVGALAAVLVVSGIAWHGMAADQATAATRPDKAATPIAHAVAAGRDSYADVVDVVAPAVVTIRTEGKARMRPTEFQVPDDDLFRRFFGEPFGSEGRRAPRTFRQRALGSGVVVSSDGYILTNFHVVDGADQINVEMTDGRSLRARLVGSDKPSDLALLKVNGTGFKSVAFGNSDAVKVGDVVLAVGNPLGVGQTVTMGIISGKGRSTGIGDGSYEDFLQTDAPINHGNSGGALVNTKGELVGINSQILSETGGNIGIGFAIPVNMAQSVMEQLRTKGKVTRAQLGVTVQQVTPEIAQNLGLKSTGGAIVSSVAPGSAADRAGLKQGDVIQSFNGTQVHDFNTLRNRVAEAGPGSTADLVIVRDGAEKHVSVKLDELNADRSARRTDGEREDSQDGNALGVSVTPLNPELADRLGVSRDANGLVVEDVDPNGRAADAGIAAGDVIQSVNRRPVKTVDDLRQTIRQSSDKPALLLINRQGRNVFVTVRPANG